MHSILTAFLAQTAPEGQQNPLMTFIPFIAIAVVFYLLFFRPQQKQAKKHQAFLTALKKGDEVVTQSGIIGRVASVEDRVVTLDIGGGTKIRVLKAQVGGAWSETPPEASKAEAKK
jgi:preprotein translocase subunit YajC